MGYRSVSSWNRAIASFCRQSCVVLNMVNIGEVAIATGLTSPHDAGTPRSACHLTTASTSYIL